MACWCATNATLLSSSVIDLLNNLATTGATDQQQVNPEEAIVDTSVMNKREISLRLDSSFYLIWVRILSELVIISSVTLLSRMFGSTCLCAFLCIVSSCDMNKKTKIERDGSHSSNTGLFKSN